MTKLQNFFKNPFNNDFETVKETAKLETASRTTHQANELFKDKPFATENKTTYLAASLIKYVANLVSFATAFFALRAVLALTVGTVVASFGAGLLCGLIELLKNSSWKTNVKQILRYKKPSFIGLGVLLLLSVLSIGASLHGAYLIPSELTAPTITAHSKNDSLVINELATINTQIANLDKMFLETSAKAIPNKDGKISSTLKTMLANLTIQKDSLSSQKRAVNAQIASVGTNYQDKEKDANKVHQEQIKTAQISCVAVALLFELIYTICCIYSFYYLFRVYIDSNPTNQPNPPAQPTNQDQINEPYQDQPSQHTPTNQAFKIGFKHYPPTNQEQPTNPHTNQVPTDIPNGFTTVLQRFENGLVGTENGIKFVWHKNKKYTKSDINNNVYAFRTKCNNYEKLADPERLQKYKQHLKVWEQYLELVTEKA